ncbi:predicted protein [Lichtheimia corymbifera JMRC:FSU:9682]|uniref:Uncharacterized protein n=1 Tax=Lichtheimia corymbifera JMRC:FSU:9682 TaxID=1263082 RepID=A0A068RKL1_9FUNG|nr:predicted protein [Lichtheimia corymbifera JMRC:FSU:9682]
MISPSTYSRYHENKGVLKPITRQSCIQLLLSRHAHLSNTSQFVSRVSEITNQHLFTTCIQEFLLNPR